MSNMLHLTVVYTHRKRVFEVEQTTSLQHIMCLISNHFCINSTEFLLEVLDKRFDQFIALDNVYLEELRSDPYFAVNRSLEGRIRSRHRLSSESNLDIDYLWPSMILESNIFLQKIGLTLPLHIVIDILVTDHCR